MRALSLATAFVSVGTTLLSQVNALTCPGTAGLFLGDGRTPYCCSGIRRTGTAYTVPSYLYFSDADVPSIRFSWSAGDDSLRQGGLGIEIDAGVRFKYLRLAVTGGRGDYGGDGWRRGNEGYISSLVIDEFEAQVLAAPLKASFLVNIRDGQARRRPRFGASTMAWAEGTRPSQTQTVLPAARASNSAMEKTSVAGSSRPEEEQRPSTSTETLKVATAEAEAAVVFAAADLLLERPPMAQKKRPAPAVTALPVSYASFAIDLEPGTCEALVGDATTVLTATVVETSSHAVDETTLPAATVISIIDEVSTVTPPTSTVNEGAVAYRTPSPSVIKTTETSVTTPLTSTIVETKTVVSIPTAQRTPAATRYVTEVSTTEPATSTSTATQTVATGFADCTTFRVVYPSACCPSSILSITSVPSSQPRRRNVRLEPRTLTDYSTTVLGVTTTTTTVDYTATVTESDVTVLTTSTEIVEASTPLTTRTRTRTVRLLPSRTTTTVIVFSDAPTPLATRASTRTVRAPLSVLRSVLFPTTTLTVQTTTTLPTPLATTTVTVDEQSSACFVELVSAYSRCPNTNSAGTAARIKANEQARLDRVKAQSGGRSVTVDCGAAGVFTY